MRIMPAIFQYVIAIILPGCFLIGCGDNQVTVAYIDMIP